MIHWNRQLWVLNLTKMWREMKSSYHMKRVHQFQVHSSLIALPKRHAMAKKCKLIMSLATYILVADRHPHSCINTSFDKYITFDSSHTKQACWKRFLGMTSPSVVVISSWNWMKGPYFVLFLMLLIYLHIRCFFDGIVEPSSNVANSCTVRD